MTIEQFLKDNNARVSLDDKWLVAESADSWTVYQHKYGAHHNTVLYAGGNLNAALKALGQEG